ncbi:MAG TPA: hypothetical protein VGM76_09340 [Lacipirellulaceae bacterium]|jgi:hypothetical protein
MDSTQRPAQSAIRRLRNVASALCLMACCAFLSFWARSSQHVDRASIRISGDRSLSLVSRPGRLQFYVTQPPSTSMWPFVTGNGWGLSSHPTERLANISTPPANWSAWGFSAISYGTASEADIPFWCPILISGIMCIVVKPPPRFRFGLALIFILITCVALVLGMFTMLDKAALRDRQSSAGQTGP